MPPKSPPKQVNMQAQIKRAPAANEFGSESDDLDDRSVSPPVKSPSNSKLKGKVSPKKEAPSPDPKPTKLGSDEEELTPSEDEHADIAFTKEQYLKLQRDLMAQMDRNIHLESEIKEKDDQLQELSNALISMDADTKVNQTNEDVIEVTKKLARKNRALAVALSQERRKNITCRNELESLKTKLVMFEEQFVAQPAKGHDETKCEWRVKFDKLNNTMLGQRQKYSSMKNELTKTQRVLQREVGNDVPLDKLLTDDKSVQWKGRAETITLLQAKIRKLTKKLHTPAGQQADAARAGLTDMNSSDSAPPSARMSTTGRPSPDFRNRQEDYVSKLTIYQKQVAEYEQFEKDLAEAHRQTEHYKKKCAAQGARIQILEKQETKWRSRVEQLLETKQGDDELVDALKDELKKLEELQKKFGDSAGMSKAEVKKAELKQQEWKAKVQELEERLHREEAKHAHNFQSALEGWDRELMSRKMDLLMISAEKKGALADVYSKQLIEQEQKRLQMELELVECKKNLDILNTRMKGRKDDGKVTCRSCLQFTINTQAYTEFWYGV
jgi:chromosome segregation ATPase